MAAERLAKAERGEDAGGVGKPMTRKEMIAALGWKQSDIRHAERLAEIDELGGFDDLMAAIMKQGRQAEKSAARAILARRRHGSNSVE